MRLRILAIAIVAALAYFAIERKTALPAPPDSTAFITGLRDQVSPFSFTLITDPDPPSSDLPIVLRVHVTDAAGQPANGLTVEASVSMSGTDRGVQHTILHDKGNGVYEGRVNLELAGTWDVDLTATKDDKRGRQRLTIEVGGPQRSPQPRNPNEEDSDS
jgi:hypothetical protein